MIHRSSLTVLCSILLLGSLSTVAQTNPSGGDKAVGAAPSNGAVAVTGTEDDKYRIGYRDKLSIQVFKHPELAQTVSVNSNGTISLFKIPEPVVAVCKTERELADDIAAAYKKDYLKNPEVNVVATEQVSQALAVIGAVQNPGNFFVNRRVHLLELLARAGGPSKEAGSRLMVVRPGSNGVCQQNAAPDDDKIGLFNFTIRDLQEGKQSFMMQPGDIVSVLDADIVYVYGHANEQGQVVMKQPMTLTQAIASAKGIKPATKDKVRIIRQKPGSLEREVIFVDLAAVDKQKAEDPYLLPNDIVALSQDPTKNILRTLTKSFTQGIPSLMYRPY
jgi:polysaccharide biosynthesis/export protein